MSGRWGQDGGVRTAVSGRPKRGRKLEREDVVHRVLKFGFGKHFEIAHQGVLESSVGRQSEPLLASYLDQEPVPDEVSSPETGGTALASSKGWACLRR